MLPVDLRPLAAPEELVSKKQITEIYNLANEMGLKATLWPLHFIHLSSEPPVLHLQLHNAST